MGLTVSPDTHYAMQSGFEDAMLFSILLFKKKLCSNGVLLEQYFGTYCMTQTSPCLYNGLKSIET